MEQSEVELNWCESHMRSYPNLICVECFDEQSKRVEQVSLPLRIANTTESLRSRVLATLAEKNGGTS